MEVTLELVQQLRQYADVSFSDAKAALEHTGGDLLEALIWLEQQGNIDLAGVGSYHTGPSGPDPAGPGQDAGDSFPETPPAPPRRGGFLARVWQVLTENRLECTRGEARVEVPLAVLIALLIFAFYVVAGLLALGFCFGWRYHFAGPELGKKAVNDVMDNIDDTAENIRETVRKNLKKR